MGISVSGGGTHPLTFVATIKVMFLTVKASRRSLNDFNSVRPALLTI